MTDLRQCLGSMLVCGFPGVDLPGSFQHLLSNSPLGGVILFSRNYASVNQATKLILDVKRCSEFPPLVAVDQEGGRVVRFSRDFPVYASPRHFGESDDSRGLMFATEKTGELLRQIGVNLNLIPVCDLAPVDPGHVIHSRSYSSDPEKLAGVVAAQVACLRKEAILSCAKHFPGLGSAYGDPHLEVSKSDQTLSDFREKDYVPFRAATEADADMIMVTHLLAPAIDPDQIATFSQIVIGGELKTDLGYTGLVISDDLQMAGALQNITASQAGVAAIAAGCDLLIYGNVTDSIEQIIDDIVQAAEHDRILAERIIESSSRVVDFKRRKLDTTPHE